MINNLIIQNQLQPADVIVAKKRTGLGRILNHYIVYLGNQSFIGNLMDGVKHLSQKELKELLIEYEPTKIRRFTGSNFQRRLALNRAYSRLGDKYNLLNFNCEHFANWVQKGKENSNQATIAVSAIAIGLVYKLFKIYNYEE
ncbi:lecithin retinol acyltransferase family protein [Aquimarina algiphila]|uniref:lecithin retinol acyltransferase family protein n=1 Tax=Aquimarina algiphila TaxID=2047982 RepID=UPI00249305D8|nr:lecithin retinol acyltransferase family protein [Aquimarina algiphila]